MIHFENTLRTKRDDPHTPLFSVASKRRFGVCLGVLFFIFVLASLIQFSVLGVREGGDTSQHTNAASNILQGNAGEGRDSLFMTYNSFLALLQLAHLPVSSALLFHLALTFAAGLLLFFAIKFYFGTLVGFLTAMLFFLNVDIQRWNFYILPETFATDLLILVVCSLLLAQHYRNMYFVFFPSLFLGLFIRPEFSYFLLPLIVYCFWKRQKLNSLLGVVLIVVFVVFFFRNSFHAEQSYGTLNLWKEGMYIWPSYAIGASESSDLIFQRGGHLFVALFRALWYDPLWLFQLLGYRLFYFLLHVKPYYSLIHNLFVLAFAFPVYIFSAYALPKLKSIRKESLLMIGLFLLQALIALIHSEDWDGRWWDRVITFLLPLAVAGFLLMFSKISNFLDEYLEKFESLFRSLKKNNKGVSP